MRNRYGTILLRRFEGRLGKAKAAVLREQILLAALDRHDEGLMEMMDEELTLAFPDASNRRMRLHAMRLEAESFKVNKQAGRQAPSQHASERDHSVDSLAHSPHPTLLHSLTHSPLPSSIRARTPALAPLCCHHHHHHHYHHHHHPRRRCPRQRRTQDREGEPKNGGDSLAPEVLISLQ